MPKIIKNVKEKIISSAIELFENNHYENVDMKVIAEKSGIAVGTLYNYYSNKRDIFLVVFERSWEKTLSDLGAISYEDGNEKVFLKSSLERLYDGILEKKYMFHELMSSNPDEIENQLRNNDEKLKDNNRPSIIKRELLIGIEKVLIKLNESNLIKISKGMEERFVVMLFMEIWGLVTAFSNEREANIEFLSNMVDLIFI